jgi:hypothetical protein
VQALNPGALVDLLAGRLALSAEAVQVLEAGEKLLCIADFVDPEFERRNVTGEELDLDAFAGSEGASRGKGERARGIFGEGGERCELRRIAPRC